MEGGNIFSSQLSPRNYIVATHGSYEQPSPPIRYGDYNYPPINYPPSGYSVANGNHNIYKQDRDYGCEEDVYVTNSNVEDVKPSIVSTTSAFNVITPPPQYNNTSHCISRGMESMDTNMTASGTFHASTYSAFSPFGSDHSSPMSHSPTQAAQSPLL